jgi:hypothetical protein
MTVQTTSNPPCRPGRGWTVLAAGLAAAVLCLAAAPARADNYDEALSQNVHRILRDLRKQHAQSVGVLKFRVKRGNRPESFYAGVLNDTMAQRLENALIVENDADRPITVLRDPSQTAHSKDRKATYMTPAGLQKLFEVDYLPAWGTRRVKADALLMGVVEIPDRLTQKKATVTIEVAYRNKPADRHKLLSFEFDLDRSTVADMGESYFITRKGSGDRTYLVLKSADDQNQTGATPVLDLIEFTIYYDGNPVGLDADPDFDRELRTSQPPSPETREVYFRFKNKTDKRLAVVVLVNDVNTLHEEPILDNPTEYTKWILPADGKEYQINGFYDTNGQTVGKFTLLSPDDPAAEQFAEAGRIKIHVFEEGSEKDIELTKTDPTLKKLSYRGLSQKQWNKAGPVSLKQAQGLIEKAVRTKPKPKMYIIRGDTVDEEVKTESFQNPRELGTLDITYFKRGG